MRDVEDAASVLNDLRGSGTGAADTARHQNDES